MKSMIAIFPGTFDPPTYGHLDLINRAAAIFSHVIVAVAPGVHKQPLFALTQRIQLLQTMVSSLSNVKVETFQGLLVNFAKAQGANIIIRGMRNALDVEYEKQLAHMNQALSPALETVFLQASSSYAFISSSLVREIAQLKGDVSAFVPSSVANALHKQF